MWTTDNRRRQATYRAAVLIHALDAVAAMAPAAYFWLQPAVTGLGAGAVLLGVGVTVRQRHKADRKDQWWKRTQWALDLLMTRDEDAIVLGLDVLRQQVIAKVADREDAAIIADVIEPWVDSYRSDVDTDDEDERG